MKEVLLKALSGDTEEATIQRWFYEEGDAVNEGDDLVELTSELGTFCVPATAAGILVEVYYDEGEIVQRDEVLCVIDDKPGTEAEEE